MAPEWLRVPLLLGTSTQSTGCILAKASASKTCACMLTMKVLQLAAGCSQRNCSSHTCPRVPCGVASTFYCHTQNLLNANITRASALRFGDAKTLPATDVHLKPGFDAVPLRLLPGIRVSYNTGGGHDKACPAAGSSFVCRGKARCIPRPVVTQQAALQSIRVRQRQGL